jgi:hypothetical protein
MSSFPSFDQTVVRPVNPILVEACRSWSDIEIESLYDDDGFDFAGEGDSTRIDLRVLSPEALGF